MADSRSFKGSDDNKLTGLNKPVPYGRYLWYFLIFITLITLTYVSVESYAKYTDKRRVYGKWTEIGAPSHATDIFVLREDGVRIDNRFVSTSFEFDGATVSFYKSDMLYEYQVFGDNDERLRRITGGGHAASFIKEGYEHTVPKDKGVGPARRVSLAEHFQQK